MTESIATQSERKESKVGFVSNFIKSTFKGGNNTTEGDSNDATKPSMTSEDPSNRGMHAVYAVITMIAHLFLLRDVHS